MFPKRKLKFYLQWALLAGLSAVLAVCLFIFVRNFEFMRLRGDMRLSQRKGPAPGQIISPNQIRGWMTFRYVNLVFYLPPGYLKDQLKITDNRYPNLTLDAYAGSQKIDSNEIIQITGSAVSKYLKNKHP